jgi:uncharacterized repeat protein (TIGR01451 family)
MILLAPVFILMAFLGGGTGEAAGTGSSADSTNLVVSKRASVTNIARGTPNAQVTYTITVTNKTSKEATNVTVTDTFTSSPNAGFAGEITGYEASSNIPSIAPGVSATKSFTVTIPHTDFDPGWILFNKVSAFGTIEGVAEISSAGATVIIGNPPSGPPAFSPLRNPFVSGYVFNQRARGSNGFYDHEGVDLGASDPTMRSPFAQPAIVIENNPEGDGKSDGFGNYIILKSGEWEVLLAHLEDRSPLSVGQTVDSNTFVGIMGNSGFVISEGSGDGTHLHYEVRQNGTLVDPVLHNALTSHP